MNIGVLISGSGSNLQRLIDQQREGLPINIVLVVASRPDAFGIERAKKANIPVLIMNRERYSDPLEADREIVQALYATDAEYVVMAGYMRKVTTVLLQAFPNKVINLHPALLPAFKGAHAIEEAFNAGVKITGVTVHFANEDYDRGPIIAQVPVPVFYTDSLEDLEERIHNAEYLIYPQVLRWIAEGKVKIEADGKVYVYENR